MNKILAFFVAWCFTCHLLSAQKIDKSYWNCKFGDTYQMVFDALQSQELDPIASDDGIYMKNQDVFHTRFATVGIKFTEENAFYNVFGYNKYTTKKEASEAFLDALGRIRELYPKVQSMSKPDGCLRLYAYTDDGQENVFSLGLYKGNNDVFFVRLNVYSNYLMKRGS